jgi:hypothetical protein
MVDSFNSFKNDFDKDKSGNLWESLFDINSYINKSILSDLSDIRIDYKLIIDSFLSNLSFDDSWSKLCFDDVFRNILNSLDYVLEVQNDIDVFKRHFNLILSFFNFIKYSSENKNIFMSAIVEIYSKKETYGDLWKGSYNFWIDVLNDKLGNVLP